MERQSVIWCLPNILREMRLSNVINISTVLLFLKLLTIKARIVKTNVIREEISLRQSTTMMPSTTTLKNTEYHVGKHLVSMFTLSSSLSFAASTLTSRSSPSFLIFLEY
ncbi:hypothetical protein KSF78_0009022 [Schistosoma japonicum]|nr:hypothetical protein KSF78_0009022 [Schistosoma japonicum]